MADYSKLQLRFSSIGLNLAYSTSALEFGQYFRLTNVISDYEGELTSRQGLASLVTGAASGAITQFKRLNDGSRNKSTYITKIGQRIYATTTGGAVTTVSPFTLTDVTLSNLFSSNAGSFVIDHPTLSNQVWCYVGDSTAMRKFAINGSSGIDFKSVGIPRPIGPPTMVDVAGGAMTLLADYDYRYTLLDNNTGVESLFNSTEGTTITMTGVNQSVNVTIPTEAVNAATTHARIYRRGGTITTWNRITTQVYTGTTFTYNDTTSDTAASALPILNEVSDQPFTITNSSGSDVAGQPLPYLWGPYQGFTMGTGDSQNVGYVYWTDKFTPDSQDPDNRVEVSSANDPCMNGFVYNGRAYVFTRESLYTLVPLQGATTFTPFSTACNRGLAGNLAFCVGPEIYFLSKDGIYATTGGIERTLTDNELRPLFYGQSVTAIGGSGGVFPPVSYATADLVAARMALFRNQLYFQYVGTDGSCYTLVYDLRYKRWRGITYNGVVSNSIYSDEESLSLFMVGGTNGKLYSLTTTTDDTAPIQARVTTGLITLNSPLIHKEFGSAVFDLNPNGTTVTIAVYADRGANLIGTITSNASSRTRLFMSLLDTFSEDLCVDISWSSSGTGPILYGYELLYKKDVIQISRWSVTGVNHGILGWQIIRSGYLTLRSDGTTTLTISVLYDASISNFTYTIPSTGGLKKRIFVPFDPIKGKLFSYTLTLGTATYFRFYPHESEIHIKPWISAIGYNRVNPFAGDSSENAQGIPAQKPMDLGDSGVPLDT